MTGELPNLSHLRIFGCPAYVHVEKSARRKLDNKSWEGIFIGYASDSPAWLVYNPSTRCVIRSANVTFDESWRDLAHAAVRDAELMNLGENSGGHWTEIPAVTPARVTTPSSSVGPSQSTNNVGSGVSSSGEQPRGEQTPGELERTPALGDPLFAPPATDSEIAAKYSEHMQAIRTAAGSAEREAAVNRLLTFGADNADDLDSIGVLDSLPIGVLDRVATDTPADGNDDAEAVAAVAAAASPIHEPRTFGRATHKSNPYRVKWKEASDLEYNAQITNGTWILVALPDGRRAIGSVWVYKVKRGANGEIVKFKARICARGDQQISDVDFSEIFAPTVRYTTLRVLLALAAYYSLEVLQFDVCTAFLNAEVNEPIYIHAATRRLRQIRAGWISSRVQTETRIVWNPPGSQSLESAGHCMAH